MNREFVTARLCALVSEVGEKVFQSRHETDCFCRIASMTPMTPHGNDPRVHEDVMKFIENAVRDAIKKMLAERREDWVHAVAETLLSGWSSDSCSPSGGSI